MEGTAEPTTLASSSTDQVRAAYEELSVTKFRNDQSISDLGRECTALHHVFGVDMSRKGNMNLIENDTIVYATTTAVVFHNVSTGAKEYLMSIGDGGIGCVAVHPTRFVISH